MLDVKKKIIIISLCVIVLGLLAFGIISFVLDYTKSKEEMEKNIVLIDTEYEKFKDQIDKFENTRDSIYESVFNEIYYETLKENIADFNILFSKYSDEITKIKDFSKTLGNACINRLYQNANVNKKCISYINAYEESINAFISDVKIYNDHIEEYNKYLDEENNNENKISLFNSTDITKYIDYNKDGEYLGKE